MTVCIAGISENSKIVAFTDRMLTIGAPIRTAFEITENNKAIQMADKVVCMFAGDVLKANAVIKAAKEKIGKNTSIGAVKVAEFVKDAFKEQWTRDIEEGLLQRFGMNRKDFVNKQKELDPSLVSKINDLIVTYNLGVEIIVAGIDAEKPVIFKIENPGVSQAQESIGYCCIGSGAQHATFSLIESEYAPSLSEAQSIHAIMQAKRRAQYDPGVGEYTDIVIINSSYSKVEQAIIDFIDAKYDASISEINTKKAECATALYKLISKE